MVCMFVCVWGGGEGKGNIEDFFEWNQKPYPKNSWRPTNLNGLPPTLLSKLNVMHQSSLCLKLCCIIHTHNHTP